MDKLGVYEEQDVITIAERLIMTGIQQPKAATLSMKLREIEKELKAYRACGTLEQVQEWAGNEERCCANCAYNGGSAIECFECGVSMHEFAEKEQGDDA